MQAPPLPSLDAISDIGGKTWSVGSKSKPGGHDAGAGFNRMSQAGRDNRDAFRDAAQKAIDHATAVAESTGSAERGERVLRGHIAALKDEAREAGITEAAINSYIEELNLTPENIKTILEIEREKALADIRAHLEALGHIPRQITTTLTVASADVGHAHRSRVQHAGGDAGSGWTRMHAGFGPRLRSDEVPAILQRGEVVLSRNEARGGAGGRGDVHIHHHKHLTTHGVPVTSFDEEVAVKLLRRMELMGA